MPKETSQEDTYGYMKYETSINNLIFCNFIYTLGLYTTHEKVEKAWKCDEHKFYIEVGELKFDLHIVRDSNQYNDFTHVHLSLI